jgi:predicted neutral ceramidase superfamily lipid hydrolase
LRFIKADANNTLLRLHGKVSDIFAPISTKIWIFSTDFHESPEYQNSGKVCPVGGALMHLTEGHVKLMGALRAK